MLNGMVVPSLKKHTKRIFLSSIGAGLLAVALGGCSAAPPPETAAQKQVLATFDVNQCKAVDVNIYRCPAVDKPVCSPEYNGNLECIRIGKKGGVYVAGPLVE